MIQQGNTYSRKSAAKGAIAFRVIVAFALAAILIPVYVMAILKVIEVIRN